MSEEHLNEDVDYLRDDMRYVLDQLSCLQDDLNEVIARVEALGTQTRARIAVLETFLDFHTDD